MSYETLVDGARGEAALADVVRFVTGADARAVTRPEHHELQQIHDGRCSHRVADWAKLRALLKGTRTAAAYVPRARARALPPALGLAETLRTGPRPSLARRCDELEHLAAVFKNDTAAAGAAADASQSSPLVQRTVEMLSSCVRNKNLLKPTVRARALR